MTEMQLDLRISEAGTDAERVDELTTRLMRDLRDLGAESVQRTAGGVAPQGAKGDPVTLGALVLIAAPTLLPRLVEFLQAWSLRAEERKIKIRTSTGVEVEFTPDKKLSEDELVSLVGKLSGGGDEE